MSVQPGHWPPPCYAHEDGRFPRAPSQRNETFSGCDRASVRGGLVVVVLVGGGRVCVPPQKLIWALRPCQRHLCLASLIPWHRADSRLTPSQRRIPARLDHPPCNLPPPDPPPRRTSDVGRWIRSTADPPADSQTELKEPLNASRKGGWGGLSRSTAPYRGISYIAGAPTITRLRGGADENGPCPRFSMPQQ